MEHELAVSKTARYVTLGKLDESTRQIWIVLHGYAQLAKEFIAPFQSLVDEGVCVIAPEALHRFYVKGFSGNVGATWMTKEAREADIQDNIHYLNHLAAHLHLQQYTSAKIVLLGFSQGVATATRWFVHSAIKMDVLIMYAGEMAAELRTNPLHPAFHMAKKFFVYGKADPLLPSFAPDAMQTLFDSNYIEVVQFEGAHNIEPSVIVSISRKL